MAREAGEMPRRPADGEDSAWIRPLLGRADDMRAEVWLRCDPAAAGIGGTDPSGGPLSLGGTLTGPSCTLAATLPTTSTFVDQGALEGRPPLARTVCTEPGFWTPELPCLYRAEVELRQGARVVAAGHRMVGLRRAGTRGGSIWLDGRRYVPRGVALRGEADELPSLRRIHAAAVVDGDRVETLVPSAADRTGVAVVVRLPGPIDVERSAATIGQWALHPSTILAVLAATVPADAVAAIALASSRSRGTMLLGMAVDGLVPPPPIPAGIDLLVVELPAGRVPHAAWRGRQEMPLVACETGAAPTPERAREACDLLQARLASWGAAPEGVPPFDWAGYLVV